MSARAAAQPFRPTLRSSAVALVLLLIAALHVLAARRLPVGVYNDDAANVLLARSLRSGSYAFPGGLGSPEEFLPAFPLLLAVPARLIEPHWNLLRAIPLFFFALCLVLTWRLARRFLSAEAAAAAVLLTALNPALINFGGLVMPNLPYLALTLALIDGAGAAESPRAFLWLAAGAGLAPLLRPQGAVLIACLALAQWRRRGLKRGLAFISLALLPAAAWTLRNHLHAGSSKDYVDTWRTGLAVVSGTPFLERVSNVLTLVFGSYFLAVPGGTAVQSAFAVPAFALAFYGALLLLKRRTDPRALVLASYAAGLAALHTTWPWVDPRYVIPFVPLLWIMIIAGAASLGRKNPRLLGALLALLIALPLPYAIGRARAGLRGAAQVQPATIAWIRENVPASSPMASAMNYSIALLADRRCYGQAPVLHASTWVAAARQAGVNYVHIELPLPGDEFQSAGFPAGYQVAFSRWLDGQPRTERVYQNLDEGAIIYRLRR